MAQQPNGSTRLPRRRSPQPARVLGAAGELLATFGLVLALFVAYSLWWTDVLADRQAEQAARRCGSPGRHRVTRCHPPLTPGASGSCTCPRWATATRC